MQRLHDLEEAIRLYEQKNSHLAEEALFAQTSAQQLHARMVQLQEEIEMKNEIISKSLNEDQVQSLTRELELRGSRIEEYGFRIHQNYQFTRCRLEKLESRLAKVTQDYDTAKEEKNKEISKLKDEMLVAKKGETEVRSEVANLTTTLEQAKKERELCEQQWQTRVQQAQESFQSLQQQLQAIVTEKQKAEACLESAQEDNQMLLEQMRRHVSDEMNSYLFFLA
jgi:chromosome segregation ATPase